MSIKHLELLRNALENNHWIVNQELPGNDYDISGYWEVSRPNGDSAFLLAFSGLDDLETLPIEKSFACHVVNNEQIGCYFAKISKSFPKELSTFIEALSELNSS